MERQDLRGAFVLFAASTEQWGAHPITDPLVVKTLQDVYRQAMGLPPAPDPPLLAQLSASADRQVASNLGHRPARSRDPNGPETAKWKSCLKVPLL